MSGDGFAKVYETILGSSIWYEDHATRIVWITMLAMADASGFVGCIPQRIADNARVSMDELRNALRILSEPDEMSRTKDNDGRRVEAIDGGFIILNHGKWRRGNPHSAKAKQMRERRVKPDTLNQQSVNLEEPGGTSGNSASASASASVAKDSSSISKDPEVCPSDQDSVSKKTRRKKTWKRVPEDWEPNDTHKAIASQRNVDIVLELAKFRDHEFASGKSNPDATFRNWLRNAKPERAGNRFFGGGDQQTPQDLTYDRRESERMSHDQLIDQVSQGWKP